MQSLRIVLVRNNQDVLNVKNQKYQKKTSQQLKLSFLEKIKNKDFIIKILAPYLSDNFSNSSD